MEVSRDHPTPYPGKTRPRVSVRSSIKIQENKTLTETNSLTTFSSKRQENGLSVSKSVNVLDLSTKEKPFKSRRGLPVPSKCAIVVSKTESKELPLAVSDRNCNSSKPFLHQSALALKTEKILAVETKVKSSKKERSVSFEDFSIRSQIKDNASNKDALLTPTVPINSTVPVTPEHPSHGHGSKLNMLTSASYWLDQIKISESAGKHAISLGFFTLALESAAEPLQRLHDELKEYALKNNLLEFGELARDVMQRYGVLEEIMSADSSGKPAELDANTEVPFSEPKGFMSAIHEMSSVSTDNGENNSIGETTMNAKVDCPSIVETGGLSRESEFKNVTNSFSEESKVFHLKTDKDVAQEDDNIKESLNNKSREVLSGLMGSKAQVLSKEHLMEGKAIGNEYVQQSILNQKSCIENRNLNETEKVVSVSLSKTSGTVLDKKNAIGKGTRSRTMPGTVSQSYTRKSSKLNFAEKAGAPKVLRSTTRHSCTIITSTKKEECARKNTRQDDKKGTPLNEFSPSDPSSSGNGEDGNRDNQPFQKTDQVDQCKDIKGFASEHIENPESRPNNSASEGSGFDILNMSVDTLMDEVVLCIMSSMDDCTDSPTQVQGCTVNSLEDNIADTVESNSRDKIMSPSTSSIPDIIQPFGIVLETYSDIMGSSIPRTEVAADHVKEEMREDLDDISCTKNNAKELGADISCILEEEQEKCFQNGANETVQLGAENDTIEQVGKVELRKSKPHVTKSKFQGSKAVTGKGSLKNDQNKVIGNSNKENINDNFCGVPSIQTGSSGNLGKEVKARDASNEGNCQNPGNCTPGSIRRSTRLRGRAAS
ncbi:hypothetical protein SUGI_0253400 [Cryptomeria japonica]|uniref:uncharacterized protein LOC131079998 n=1 Tax=Cryptomeria japonica TaxID=3369 RepID=UPI002408DD80|nr:uncharacterized protein LOC131079998 [Cryptomeria japonica]GLJ15434.1 hypothetical protein SUGI_0253400 [Cryptomeria japonica]